MKEIRSVFHLQNVMKESKDSEIWTDNIYVTTNLGLFTFV